MVVVTGGAVVDVVDVVDGAEVLGLTDVIITAMLIRIDDGIPDVGAEPLF